MVSSFSDPLLHSFRFHKILPTIVIEKDKIIPILIHDILKPNIKSCQPSRILGFIQEIKEKENIESYFKKLYNAEIERLHQPMTFDNIIAFDNECIFNFNDFSIYSSVPMNYICIPNNVKKWLLSEDPVNIATNIDATRYDNAASNDLCEALGLLNIENEYINCNAGEL